jgi:hypothetical protein
MAGTSDAAGTPVLMVAYNGESCVRMFKLPDFSSKGVLTPVGRLPGAGSAANSHGLLAEVLQQCEASACVYVTTCGGYTQTPQLMLCLTLFALLTLCRRVMCGRWVLSLGL